jgi:callose synthase
MAALQFPKDIQTWLLFHNALSQGVVIEDILKYARKSQEQSAGSEDAISEDATELKKVLNQQVRYIIHYTAYFTARYV